MEKNHSNLYYIFQLDYAEHLIPPDFLQQLREILLGIGSGENHPP